MTDDTTTTPAPLTADERAELAEEHVAYLSGVIRGQLCRRDRDDWPCLVVRLLATVDAAEQRATAAEAEAAHYESALRSIARGIWIAKADACLDTIGFIAREALRKAVQEAKDAISDSGQSARLKD